VVEARPPACGASVSLRRVETKPLVNEKRTYF